MHVLIVHGRTTSKTEAIHTVHVHVHVCVLKKIMCTCVNKHTVSCHRIAWVYVPLLFLELHVHVYTKSLCMSVVKEVGGASGYTTG